MRTLPLLLALAASAAIVPQAHAVAMTKHDARPAASTPDSQPTAPAPAGVVVGMAPRPRTPLDTTARQLVAQDLAESTRAGDTPLLLTGSAALGNASDRPAIFVQLQSARECGSAGCSTSVFVWQHAAWKKVLDGVGGRLTISPHRTRGMSDLITDDVRYAWSGTEYKDTRPQPPDIDLRRRR